MDKSLGSSAGDAACQFEEQYNHFGTKLRGLETSRGLLLIYPTG